MMLMTRLLYLTTFKLLEISLYSTQDQVDTIARKLIKLFMEMTLFAIIPFIVILMPIGLTFNFQMGQCQNGVNMLINPKIK